MLGVCGRRPPTPDACLQFITNDASFRVGNAEPLVGRSAVASGLRQFWGAFDGTKHHITNEWSDGDARIIEANVDYTRKDGRVMMIPAIRVYAMAGALVRRAQVFVDLACAQLMPRRLTSFIHVTTAEVSTARRSAASPATNGQRSRTVRS